MIAKPAVAVAKPSRSFELHQLAAPMIHKLSIELVAELTAQAVQRTNEYQLSKNTITTIPLKKMRKFS